MERLTCKRKFTCTFCHKNFPRLEHVQRHERTHTKETPFKCPCGRSFSRRDLLRRHEKAFHNGERIGRYEAAGPALKNHRAGISSGYHSTSVTAVDSGTATHGETGESSKCLEEYIIIHPSQLQHSCNELYGSHAVLSESLEDSASRTASAIEKGPLEQIDMQVPVLFDVAGDLSAFYSQLDGIDSFLDMVDFTPSLSGDGNEVEPSPLPDPANPRYPQDVVPETSAAPRQLDFGTNTPNNHEATLSRLGSPLPDIRFSLREADLRSANQPSQTQAQRPCWRITRLDYQKIMHKIEAFSDMLPEHFHMPSRHSLSRYLEGCIRGLCEHLPFLHTPTFSATEASPELILTLAAMGAQFRLEIPQSLVLFYAGKNITLEQVRRRDKERADEHLSRLRHSDVAANQTRSTPASLSGVHQLESTTGRLKDTSNTNQTIVIDQQLQTIQSLLILLTMGALGPRELVREGIPLQSLATTLIREDLNDDLKNVTTKNLSEWRRWALMEGRKRAKLMVYAAMQLATTVYNTPPMMLYSEVDCYLPASGVLWNAKTEDSWREAYEKREIEEITFRESLEGLYQESPIRNNVVLSPLANYLLILAILQQIFLCQQSTATTKQNIRSNMITKTVNALKRWQAGWEMSPESSVDPFSSSGPVAFNSTALLRMAWIRLYADLGPCRELASRDPHVIVTAFKKCPQLQRGAELIYPVLQASYALAIPIRMGLQFVAKTQTMTWSVQHSLSNLECAIFLSKWLEVIAATLSTSPLTQDEMMLVQMIHGLLKETGLFQDMISGDMTDRIYQKRRICWLATGVARIWAEIFKGIHIYEIVNIIGASFAIYAEVMENEFQQDGISLTTPSGQFYPGGER